MVPLVTGTGVKYAKTLLPETLMRSVSAAFATISQHIMPRVQHRCFNVCTHNRRMRQDLMASSLEELLAQAARMFVLSCCLLTLVLEEDGTVVDSEEFFQSLPNNTALMVLHRGEMWTKKKVFPNCCQPTRSIIAKLAFDLYKLHPKDFLCSFGIEASLYEMYKLSYDFKCTKMKHILKLMLCCLTSLVRQAGQLLIYSSSSLLQLIGEDDC
ncbi:cell death activator CIDE-A [Mastacembelus armatus]|uniref:cell death activator CIDE-A n=1 Tax=Mastacembelus armatus TaxID=205130 RepID=UPI000E4545D3|nr:cell death activator CIDE-A-like [Mastacembelus armatus]